MIRAFFFLIISFVTYSCSLEFGSSNNSNDMKEVEDLQRKLNALEFSFKSIDTIAVETALIRYIKNGEEMLVLQAEESWKIWNSDIR